MNNIVFSAFIACFVIGFPNAGASESNHEAESSGIKKNQHLCESFAEYAVISKDLLGDGSLTKDDVELLSAKFIVQTDDFRSLSKDRQDAWVEFMSNASDWAYRNKGSEDFYIRAKSYCEKMISEAKKRVKERAIKCHSLASLITTIQPIYAITRDKELTVEILDSKLDTNKVKSGLLIEAIEFIERGLREGIEDIPLHTYQQCLTEKGPLNK